MTDFIPDKTFLRGLLLHYFNMNKNASETLGILKEVYGEHALTERGCNNWFKMFKSGNFHWIWVHISVESENYKVRDNDCKHTQTPVEVDPESLIHYFNGDRIIQKQRKYLPKTIPKPKKLFLRIVLLHYFNMKKNASETLVILKELYGEQALTERTCHKWFKQFGSGNFNLEDADRIGAPKKFKDKDLKRLLRENSSVTQEELAKTFGVHQQTISCRLQRIGMIRKGGKWVHESQQECVKN